MNHHDDNDEDEFHTASALPPTRTQLDSGTIILSPRVILYLGVNWRAIFTGVRVNNAGNGGNGGMEKDPSAEGVVEEVADVAEIIISTDFHNENG